METPCKPGIGWAPDLGRYLRTTNSGEKMVLLPIRFLRINDDIAIWSAPVELFCEIAMHIRSLSPFPYTFYFGYANGWLGYFPTKAEFPYGGYEPNTSPYTEQAEERPDTDGGELSARASALNSCDAPSTWIPTSSTARVWHLIRAREGSFP